MAEAHYVCAVLNLVTLDALLGPLRRREQRGHPDVHKKIFDVASFPQFDTKNPVHLRLSELGNACTIKVEGWLAIGGAGNIKSIGKLRSMVREILREELKEIDADALVQKILGK